MVPIPGGQGTLMKVSLHPQAQDRMRERGATEEEVIGTIERGARGIRQN